MISVAQFTAMKAESYTGEEKLGGLTNRLFLFLQAGFWNYTEYPSSISSYDQSQVRQAVHTALPMFINNTHFYDTSENHTYILIDFATLIYLAELDPFYLHELTELIRRRHTTRSYLQDPDYSLVGVMFDFIRDRQVLNHTFLYIQENYSSDLESQMIHFIELLIDVVLSSDLFEKRTGKYFPRRALEALQFILDAYNTDQMQAIFPAAKEGLRNIVQHYRTLHEDRVDGGFFTTYRGMYLSAIYAVTRSYNRTKTNLRDLYEEALAGVYPFTRTCDKYIIRSRADIDLQEVCQVLMDQEELFHQVMDTDRRPVPNDFNDILEVIIYGDPISYSIYSATFIPPGTAGGSMYLEGNPTMPSNIARAWTVLGSGDFPFDSIRHEVIHYLDGRYNLYGPYSSGTHENTLWFQEGLAEYLSKGNNHPMAIEDVTDVALSFGSFVINAPIGHRYYSIAYLAFRFMFEKHPEDIVEILDYFYKGDYQAYTDYISSFSKYDEEFNHWAKNEVMAHNGPIPRITRKPRPGEPGYVEPPPPTRTVSAAVPLMESAASHSMRQGFVRIVNESDRAGVVRVLAFDAAGNAAEPIEIQLGANQAVHFNSNDLEQGNAAKGIEGIGLPRQGDWQLSVETSLAVRVLGFARTGDGFLTAMGDTLPRDAQGRLAAYTFNPASNDQSVSKLRLVNAGGGAEQVSIEGVDDRGNAAGPATLTLAAGESRTLSALELENGTQGLAGTLGDGAGKWRLFITAGDSVVGVNLMESATGHATNLSSATEILELGRKRSGSAVPLMIPASDSMRQGFVRIINESGQDGELDMLARDDGGYAVSWDKIPVGANQAVHFNSNDLENGNAAKGIREIGPPSQGDWRLGFGTYSTPLEGWRVLSYVRTGDGFLTAMHDKLPRDAEGRLVAHTFNPGSNRQSVSKLRLVNHWYDTEQVTIEGVDDQGNRAGPVTLTLAAEESRTLSALELETGSAEGLTGALGDGVGKWRLFITASLYHVDGMSLLEAETGHLTNISAIGVATAEAD